MSIDYKNSELSPEVRAEALLREMSLEEKMAQVNTIFPWNEKFYDDAFISEKTKYGIGEVSTLEVRRVETLEEAAAWQRKVQRIVMENSPHNIPAIFHMEGLCGAFIQDATSFPAGIGRGAGWDPDLEEKIAEVVCRQETACGFTHILAPVLDISRDSRMGRQGETYGEDPTLAAAMGVAYAKGIQKQEHGGRRADGVAKHFLAFHNSQGGIHGTHSDTPPRLLREIYGKPFQAAIREAGLKGIMPCYCTIDGEQVSASRHFLTDLLRDEMGFDGLVISDYGAVSGAHQARNVGETLADAGLMCMEAGMDVEMPEPGGFNEALKQRFADGEADIEILNRAVLRVLEAKFRMGLFEHPYACEGEELKNKFCQKEDKEITLQSAKESLVLLKNDGVLPLKKDVKKIALIGPHADSARKYFGGYTHLCMMESTYAVANSIAGVAGIPNESGKEVRVIPGTFVQSDETEEFDPILHRQKPEALSVYAQMKKELPDVEISYAYGYPVAGEDTSGFEEALRIAEQADIVILTLGGKHGTCSMATMGEGVDTSNINLPPCQDAFIKQAAELGKPMVGVHFDGRPISSDAADQYLNAILEAWSPSECGAEAVTDALLGRFSPGGKLPVSVARNAGQIPIYYNHPNGSAWHQTGSIGFANYVDLPHTPRYYFGHGLSYTTFAYKDLSLSETEIDGNGSITIEATIENTGKCVGDEVVQLYLQDCYATMSRPVKELAGFLRITLQPGEQKRVRFEVEASQMAFLDMDMRWRVEQGEFAVELGSSSEDIRLKSSYRVSNTVYVEGRERVFYAKTLSMEVK